MKCYLMLRENVESGPFTLEEMKAKTLLPTDLIWIEGLSQSWKFPYEIRELASLVQQKGFETFWDSETIIDSAENKRVFVALPALPAEKNGEPPYPSRPGQTPESETGFVQPLETLKANLEEHKKKQIRSSARGSKWGLAAAVLVGLLGGALVIQKMMTALEAKEAGVVAAALPAAPIASGTQEDKTYRNALATEIVPVDTLAAAKPKKEAKKIPIKKQVYLSASDFKKGMFGGIHRLKLLVENDSEQILDKVTIEVKYLKPNGDVISKETHTVLAVAPKSSKTLELPSSNRGVDFKYRIVSIKSHEAEIPMRDL